MRKKTVFLLVILLLLTVSGCQRSIEPPSSALSQREQNWIEDFDYLKETLVEVHPDPFWCCSEEDFDWKIGHLASRVPNLTDSEIFFELMQIVSGLRDNHIAFLPPPFLSVDILPIDVQYFDGHLYLCGYFSDYKQFAPYLLREIIAINGLDVTYIFQKYSTCTVLNYWANKEHISSLLTWPAFLDMIGCDYHNGYTLQFLNENREVVSVEVPVLSESAYRTELARSGGKLKLVRPENWDSLFYLNEGNWAEYVEGDDSDCVYMSIGTELQGNNYYYSKLIREAEEIICSHQNCRKLVIDLRRCYGGDVSKIDDFQKQISELLKPWIEQVYVLTSGYTASGAITVLAICKDELEAVIVGEPTGQFSNLFGFSYAPYPYYTLPNSQIMVSIPNMQYIGPEIREVQYDENGRWYEWENTILPDVFVSQDIQDIRQGKDSVVEWVLEQ